MSFLVKAMTQAAAGAGGVEKDEYFNQTTLLLHGDGNQGANNFSNAGPPSYLAFSDNSDNDFPITVNGDAYGTPFSPYSLDDGYWSVYIGGVNDWVDIVNSGALLGSGAWTMECWFYATTTGVQRQLLDFRYPSGGQNLAVFLQTTNEIAYWNGTVRITGGTVAPNQWNHVLCSRDGSNDVRLFLNGVQIGSAYNDTTNYTTAVCRVGCANTGADFQGYISNVRLVNGSAVQTSGFTVPTSPLTDISGTTFLGLQSNRFVDNSATPVTSVTPNDAVSIKTLNPFNATVDGTTGSGYLIGTGNYLTVAETSGQFTFGTGDYEYSFWIYPNDTSTTQKTLFGRASNGNADIPYIYLTATTPKVSVYYDSIIATGATTINPFEWTYVVISRVSGTTRIFVNGVLDGSGSDIYDLISPTTLTVGNNGTGSSTLGFPGYIADARIRKGYGSTSVTVPTTTSTAETGTQLLTCQYQGTVRNVGFIDSSPNNFPITRNGNTTQGSFSPFSNADGEWSVYVSTSTSDRLTFTNDAAFDLGSGDFTIEAKVYGLDPGTYAGVIAANAGGTTWYLEYGSTRGFTFYATAFGTLSGSSSLVKNQWVALAVTREGSTLRMFVDGVLTASHTVSGSMPSGLNVSIGNYNSGAYVGFNGWIADARIVKGRAVYTGNYTVNTTPLGTTSGGDDPPQGTETSLLTCQSNRFLDKASTPHTATAYGSVAVQPFSPFAPSAAYDPSVNGGSAYFDGTTDWLSVANDSAFDMAADDFTIEGWFYQTTASGEQNIFGKYEAGQTSFLIQINAGTWVVRIYYGSTSNLLVYNSAAPAINQWCHFALERNGANNEFYVNGVRLAQVGAQTMRTSTAGIAIGALGTGYVTSREWDGYLSSLRIVKGRAVYDGATYTIPTAPLTATSGGDDPPQGTETSLLLSATNAGIFDNTGKNNLETVGNAQIDTATKKYGTGSMEFDGTGDWLRIPATPNLDMGTGSATVECWLYITNTIADYRMLVSDATNGNNYITLRGGGTGGRVEINVNGTSFTIDLNNSISQNTWHHFAVVRSGTTFTAYVDGSSLGTGTSSDAWNLGNGGTFVGRFGGTTAYEWPGLIDDLRITKGVARYTAAFTPPTKAFPDL